MIRNQWYAVLESHEVPPGRPVAATRMGERLVFWRDAMGRIVCQRDLCPHRGAALSAGELVDSTVMCPFHGFRFDAQGCCQLVPANGGSARPPKSLKVEGYPAQETHGFIFIWWGEASEGLPPPRFFDNLDGGFEMASARDAWKAHYSRVIENQLDVAHLPFVHHNTIGRGGRTLVDGPLVEWQDADKFFVYVFNREDNGTPPRKSGELTRPEGPFHLEFIFPNLWQNHISEDVRVLAAFVPVDEENTLLYLRFYQRFLRVPVLGKIITRLAMPSNVYIARQDRRVVETQMPKPSGLRGGEKLIQADGPVIAYRRRRQELMDLA